MGFMQPVVFHDEYLDCETTMGRDIVPIDLVKRPENLAVGRVICPQDDPEFTDVFEDVSQFVEGTIDSLELKSGWLARMSAPRLHGLHSLDGAQDRRGSARVPEGDVR